MPHAKTLTGLHNSQLEAHEAVTSKTDLKWVPESYQARIKKPKRKQNQGTKTLKQLGNTASDDVNRAAENPTCS